MRGLFSRVAQAVEGTGPDAPAPADAGGASERQGGVPSGSASARRAEQRQDSGDARFAIDDEEEEEEEEETAAEDGKGEARAGSAADGSSAGDAAPAAAPAAAPGFGPTAPGPLSPLGHRILAALAPGEPQTSSGIHKALEGHGGAAGVAVFGGGSGSARTVVLLSRQRLVVGASEPGSPDSFVVTRNLHVTELVKLRFGKEGQSLRLTLRGQSPDDGLVVQVSDRRGMVAALRDTLLGHR
ncbi:hypothetical protein FNF29_02971 [Cafeteria roenbergensis]|uniref:Uncharacterized protein n=1 Tax=Cafeteria roenbergensis TaxID=33653 RepID=A0A5A8CKF4_CAFRO|nr:hypothetical protein FNF29_02971 [Cafeteria roenbergensis]KAA0159964.1 hypothetical protein FNF31_04609 [Cafeteria roenbergensis]|eukprot:KAA0153583.1 hypothetical protein FNF29_02971 [Cafeteria roenbergensis]